MRIARVPALLLALVVASVMAACGNELSYGSDLVKTPFEKLHVKKLPGGGRVAVGSPDGHSVTVQWQDPNGKSWTEPQVVYRDEKFWTHDINVEVARTTVAIDPDFWTQKKLDDDYAPNHTAQVICSQRDCLPGHRTEGSDLSGTSLTRDGTFASFGLGDRRVLLWDSKSDFRTETWTGLPAKRVRIALGPGDAFSAVAGLRVGKGCRYDLYTSQPRQTRFTLAARSAVYVGSEDSCDGNGRVLGKKIEVYVEATSSRFTFERRGSKWSAVDPDLGLAMYPDTKGRKSLIVQRLALPNGGEIAIGSPDAKRIVVQSKHNGGPWSEPRVVAQAPAGDHCGRQEQLGVIGQPGTLIRCYSDDIGSGPGDPSSGFAVFTSDGRDWQALPLVRPLEQPSVSAAATASIVVGAERSYVISSHGVKTLDLPLNTPFDGMTFAPGGKGVFGITGNDDRNAPCRPTWRVAAFSANGWGPAHPIKLPADFPSKGRCFTAAYSGGDKVSGEVGGVSPNYFWQFDARPKGDTYVFKGFRG